MDRVFDVGAGAGPCTGPDADVSGPPLPADDVLTMCWVSLVAPMD